MTKDRSGRRVYRKSPGRQYGYDYNRLRGESRGGQSQSGRSRASAPGERQAAYEDAQGSEASRPGGYSGLELAPRPDPRRTRQLMRQSILASKARTALYGEQEDEAQDQQAEQHEYEEQEPATTYGNRASPRCHSARLRTPSQALYGTANPVRETGEA